MFSDTFEDFKAAWGESGNWKSIIVRDFQGCYDTFDDFQGAWSESGNWKSIIVSVFQTNYDTF